ncbi:MAG TPA: Ig-like domain-containing protein [Gemmatimonadaceae bacterium]
MHASRRTVCLLTLAPIVASLSCGGSSDAVGPSGPVASVEVTPAADTVRVGGSVTLQVVVHDPQGHVVTAKTVFWDSEHPEIATVDDQGVVTGVAPGNVTVAASVSGKSGSATITVLPPGVASVTIDPSGASVQVGGTVQLHATTLDANGNALTGRGISWSSSANATATVDQNGVVTGVAPGSATITATSEGKSATATVQVSTKPVASVTVSPSSTQITVGQTVQLHATTLDAQGKTLTGRSISWQSSNDGIATVSSSGLVTGVAQGTVTISATSEGKTGKAQVGVAPVPANAVIISPSSATIVIGQTMQLSAQVTDAKGNVLQGRSITWTSQQSNIATVDANGKVTGVAQGTATITATSGSASGHATITVNPVPVASVDVAPSSANLNVGGTQQLTATPKDANGHPLSGRTISWSSNNPGAADVNASTGLVTAKAPGSAVITATCEGQKGFATINVAQVAVASVDISPQNPSVAVGDTLTLTATPKDANGNVLTGRSVQWFSSEESTASISPTGATTALVTGKGVGQATITATSGDAQGKATVTVTQAAVASVVVSPAADTIQAGGSVQLSAVTKDKNGNTLSGRTIAWSSSNAGVASVDANGKVTGVSAGSATITATSEGKSGTAQITVTPAPVGSIRISPDSASVPVYHTVQFSAAAFDVNGQPVKGSTVMWASSNGQIATATASGPSASTVAGIAPGLAMIIASAEGRADSAKIAVTPPLVARIVVAPPSDTLVIGGTAQLVATRLDEQGNPLSGDSITWESNHPNVATISETGLVSGVALGTATMTASSEGVKGSSAITVIPVPVAKVVVAPADTTMTAGDHAQLRVTLADAAGDTLSILGRTITWASSDDHLAGVDQKGVVTAKMPGVATITATSEGQPGSSTITIVKK